MAEKDAQGNSKKVVVQDNSKNDSSDDDEQDGKIHQMRNVLNQNKIKLWQAPFFADGKTNLASLVELSEQLQVTVEGQDANQILKALKCLQKRALDRVKAKSDFQTSSKIRLKLKLAKSPKNNPENSKIPKTIEVDKDGKGSDLAGVIANAIGCKSNELRVICGGKVLDTGKKIVEQGVKPGVAVMAVRIDPDVQEMKVLEEQRDILNGVKSDAELLGDDDDGGQHGLNVADQTGKSIELPREEKKSLIIAMSLHEKGRSALQKKDFNLALVLLLEADLEFSKVRSELLKNVDNYGLLNLDIVWCYVKLGSINQLDDAVSRLSKCKQVFHKAYGENLERVDKIKGSTGSERALYLRLHVLESIAQYHSGDPVLARQAMDKAKEEILQLDVDQEALDEVMANGYTEREARLALRSTGNKVAEAIKLAQQKREERQKIEKEERVRAKKRRKYGKTQNGDWVNIGYVNSLMSMGYLEDFAMVALKQTNNDLNQAIDMITNSPDVLDSAVVSYLQDNAAVDVASSSSSSSSGQQQQQQGNSNNEQQQQQQNQDNQEANTPESKKKRREEAEDRLVSDLGENLGDAEAHLDLALTEEKELMDKYEKILQDKKN